MGLRHRPTSHDGASRPPDLVVWAIDGAELFMLELRERHTFYAGASRASSLPFKTFDSTRPSTMELRVQRMLEFTIFLVLTEIGAVVARECTRPGWQGVLGGFTASWVGRSVDFPNRAFCGPESRAIFWTLFWAGCCETLGTPLLQQLARGAAANSFLQAYNSLTAFRLI
jgi:hypothetical protein